MSPAPRGQVIIPFVCLAALAACVGPMQLGEAKERAQDRMARYCQGRCGALTLTHTQKIKDRWLIDFDSPAHKYTVTVDGGGNAKVDVWDKNP